MFSLVQCNVTRNMNNVLLDFIISNVNLNVEKSEYALTKKDVHHPFLYFKIIVIKIRISQ